MHFTTFELNFNPHFKLVNLKILIILIFYYFNLENLN